MNNNFDSDQPVKSAHDCKVVVVTSGKGGVGKTTTSVSMAIGLANRGFKVCIIDFDIGLRNVDLLMGLENRISSDIIQVIAGSTSLRAALIPDRYFKDSLFLLAASQRHNKDDLTLEGVGRVLNELRQMGFDYIICDSPAGIENGALYAMYFADEAVIVTNPEVSSMNDSDRIIGLLDLKTKRAEEGRELKKHLLITRYDPERVTAEEMLDTHHIMSILALKLQGVIPESKDVQRASARKVPVIAMEDSDVSQAYFDFIDRFLGKEVPWRFVEDRRKGFFARLFGKK